MLRNYIIIAWRSITKRRFYSLLNITGLSIGIVITFLIGAYVWGEWMVNRELKHADNQYLLLSEWKDPNIGNNITTLGPLAKRLKEDYPSLVANYYRWDGITSVVSKGDKHLRGGIQLGDSTLLNMYGFELLHGDASTALVEPFSVVITKDAAKKYFDRTDVVGETLSIQSFSGGVHDFTVTGVIKELPENSVTQLNDANKNNFFIPTNTRTYFGRADFEDWTNIYLPSYIEVHKGVKTADIEKAIKQLIVQNTSAFVQKNLIVHPEKITKYYQQQGFVKRMLYALSFTAAFILLMAIVNFINISVSSSTSRIKEMGIRKVLGGLRKQLIVQFVTESLILVLLSTLLALAAYSLLRPLFNEMVGKSIPELSSFPFYFIGIPVALVILVGALAGLYPAFVLSSIRSADSIRGNLKSIKEKVWLRKSLAGFQFAVAGVVMISAFIVSNQITYFFGRSLGYDKEYVVASQVPRDWTPAGVQKMETARNEFASLPVVASVALSYEIPNGMNGGQAAVYKPGMDSTQAITTQLLATDEHYLETYRISLMAGTFLETSNGFNPQKLVLNETAVHALGWKNSSEAIGQQIRMAGDNNVYTIAGVVGDFHFGPMQQRIQPFIFVHVREAINYRYLSFKLKPGHIGDAITAIERKWASLLPGSSFEYKFMDETLQSLYKTELQLKKASYTATLLSIVIVLLGVIGLVSLSVQKRAREIGIRKVVGASIADIIALFVADYLPVLLVAGLIACPVAWWVMQHWLNDYEYRATITAIPFVVTIGALVVVTAGVIILQTAQAALTNPVKSLKAE